MYFSKRFIFLKDASPEADTRLLFESKLQNCRTKKKSEYMNLEGSLSISNVEVCTVHEDSHEKSRGIQK